MLILPIFLHLPKGLIKDCSVVIVVVVAVVVAVVELVSFTVIYSKISIISPGLIFVQKAFLMGLFSGELIFGGAYYWKEFCVSKWVCLDNKNSLNC